MIGIDSVVSGSRNDLVLISRYNRHQVHAWYAILGSLVGAPYCRPSLHPKQVLSSVRDKFLALRLMTMET